jgi:hypothetical protein
MGDRELVKLTRYLLLIAQTGDFRTLSHKVRLMILPVFPLPIQQQTFTRTGRVWLGSFLNQLQTHE